MDGFISVVAVEGRTAGDHEIEDDATAPEAALLVVILAKEYFRRIVIQLSIRPENKYGAGLLGALLLGPKHLRSPEVDDLDGGLGAGAFEDYVFRLEIAMGGPLSYRWTT